MKHLANTPGGDNIILVSGDEIGVIKRLLGCKLTLSLSTLSRIQEHAQHHLGDEITGAAIVAVLGAYDAIVPQQILYYADENGEVETVEI